ncbi:MAG: hypothetical protein LBQ66_11545, partial [Planctomycetaceae bacterium]|nr:hypothetical protein [Planctomycetaceae bacterium]
PKIFLGLYRIRYRRSASPCYNRTILPRSGDGLERGHPARVPVRRRFAANLCAITRHPARVPVRAVSRQLSATPTFGVLIYQRINRPISSVASYRR